MKWRHRLSRGAAIAALGTILFRVEAAPGPIRVSPNGRYFVDDRGEPFYFLADTQWELFRSYSLSDAQLIIENRKAKGFTVVMVMLTGVGSGTAPNLNGHHPWLNDNPAAPNPDFFSHVDAVVKLAQANDLHLLIGICHQTHGNRMTMDNARSWAAWVTSRYRDLPNIIWTLYPKAADSYRAIIAKLVDGIQEGDRGKHLVSMHPDPSPASSSFMHAEPWLSFNSIQVWNQLGSVYPMTFADYNRMPAKPVTMLEGVFFSVTSQGWPVMFNLFATILRSCSLHFSLATNSCWKIWHCATNSSCCSAPSPDPTSSVPTGFCGYCSGVAGPAGRGCWSSLSRASWSLGIGRPSAAFGAGTLAAVLEGQR